MNLRSNSLPGSVDPLATHTKEPHHPLPLPVTHCPSSTCLVPWRLDLPVSLPRAESCPVLGTFSCRGDASEALGLPFPDLPSSDARALRPQPLAQLPYPGPICVEHPSPSPTCVLSALSPAPSPAPAPSLASPHSASLARPAHWAEPLAGWLLLSSPVPSSSQLDVSGEDAEQADRAQCHLTIPKCRGPPRSLCVPFTLPASAAFSFLPSSRLCSDGAASLLLVALRRRKESGGTLRGGRPPAPAPVCPRLSREPEAERRARTARV